MNKVISALRKMHNIERAAVEIYRAQIRAFPENEIADRLKAAMVMSRSTSMVSGHISKSWQETLPGGLFLPVGREVVGFCHNPFWQDVPS